MAQHEAEAKEAFVEWYVTPDTEKVLRHRKQFAELANIPDRTLYEWEHSAWFKEAVEKRFSRLNTAPDRIQAVVDAMWRQACTGSIQAASLYLAYIEKLSPTKQIKESKEVSEMSDEELKQALLAAAG